MGRKRARGGEEIESESDNGEEPEVAAPMTPVMLVEPIASYPPCLGVEFKNDEQVPQVSLIDRVIQEVEKAMVNKDPPDFYFSIVGI